MTSIEYSGVRVVPVTQDIINDVYKEKIIPVELLDGRVTRHLCQNEYVVLKWEEGDRKQSVITRFCGENLKFVDRDISVGKFKPRNKEQVMALDALLDDSIRVVVLTGKAGSGKTLMALLAATQKMEQEKYSRMILTRPMTWVGNIGLGYLPGDVDEKFLPYTQNYMDNIELMVDSGGKSRNVDHFLDQYRVDFIPIQLIRGASWMDSFVIADEVQVLGYDEMVALGTRIGDGSKLVILGDLAQRDEDIARDKTGIYKFVNDPRVKDSPLVASIELRKSERGAVSALFADVFER